MQSQNAWNFRNEIQNIYISRNNKTNMEFAYITKTAWRQDIVTKMAKILEI